MVENQERKRKLRNFIKAGASTIIAFKFVERGVLPLAKAAGDILKNNKK